MHHVLQQEDEYFPQFRSFDWFCGHSWARGLLFSYDGKDQVRDQGGADSQPAEYQSYNQTQPNNVLSACWSLHSELKGLESPTD